MMIGQSKACNWLPLHSDCNTRRSRHSGYSTFILHLFLYLFYCLYAFGALLLIVNKRNENKSRIKIWICPFHWIQCMPNIMEICFKSGTVNRVLRVALVSVIRSVLLISLVKQEIQVGYSTRVICCPIASARNCKFDNIFYSISFSWGIASYTLSRRKCSSTLKIINTAVSVLPCWCYLIVAPRRLWTTFLHLNADEHRQRLDFRNIYSYTVSFAWKDQNVPTRTYRNLFPLPDFCFSTRREWFIHSANESRERHRALNVVTSSCQYPPRSK